MPDLHVYNGLTRVFTRAEGERRHRRHLERAGARRRRRYDTVRPCQDPLVLQERLANDCVSDFYRYKIGDSFISLPLPEVQEMLSASSSRIEEEVSAVAEKLSGVREEMSQLKVQLYARFGRSINLET